jgi:hypothetical protein
MVLMYTSNRTTEQLGSVAMIDQRFVLNQKRICELEQDHMCLGRSQHVTDVAIALCDA